jgi:ATP-dependent Zn protease
MPGPTKQLQATAYHESGHVIAALYFDLSFEYVTIKPNIKENSLGHVQYTTKRAVRKSRIMKKIINSTGNLTLYNRIIIESEIISNFSGFFAERKFTGRGNKIGASSDWKETMDTVRVIESSDNVNDKYLNYCAALAEEIVINHSLEGYQNRR